MALSLALPILAFVGLILWQFAGAERARLEGGALGAARSAAVAIDRELTGLLATLDVLALSPFLQNGDLAAFHRQAADVERRVGVIPVLRALDGQQLVNVRRPYGDPLPRAATPADQVALATGRAAVSDLFVGAVAGAPLFTVVTPVLRDGEPAYLLGLSLDVDRIRRVVLDERLPEGWTVAVVDRAGVILARNNRPEEFVGKPATRDLLDSTGGREGTWRGFTADGQAVFGAYARSRLSDWRVAVGVREADLSAPLRRSLGYLAALGAGFAALSALLAGHFGRRIARPLQALVDRAAALGRGEPVPPVETPLAEVRQVGDALAAASAELAERGRERDAAEARSREREERLGLIVEGAKDHAILTTDPNGTITGWSAGAEATFGWTAAEAVGQPTAILFTPEDRAAGADGRELATAAREGRAKDERWQLRRDGSHVFMNGSVHPLHDGRGRAIGFLRIARDETGRRATDETAAKLAAIVSATPDAVVSLDAADGRITSWNRGAEHLFGYAEAEAVGAPVNLLVSPGHITAAENGTGVFDRAMADGQVSLEGVRRRKDGTLVDVAISAARMTAADGRVIGVSAIFRDITEQKRAVARLRESEARFRNLADHAPVMVWTTGPDGACTFLSRSWFAFTGQTEAEALGFGWLDAVHPDDRGWSGEVFRSANAKREAFRLEYRLRRADGAFAWAIDAASPRFGADGGFLGYVGSVVDIDERKRAEERLAESEAALRDKAAEFEALAENVSQLAWMAEPDGHIFWYNKRWYDYTGTDLAAMQGWGWREIHHPDHVDRVLAEVRANWARGEPWGGIYLLRGKDGVYRPFLTRAEPIRDEAGRLVRWFGTNTDITAQRDAEAALAELNATLERRVAEAVAEREKAEAQLRQAQKMEAVGRLTGGVAHDFNNLLTVVTGNLEMLRRRMDGAADPRLSRHIDNAMEGARRAAQLTQRLLAFSRQSPLQPEVVDTNRIVSGMSDLLRRTLGEPVAVETVLAGGLWRTEADPNQMENALLNLAVNARDAMPEGGKLTIETANAHLDESYPASASGEIKAGQYVLVSVSDTGTGMTADVKAKVFEPFFTTKPVGKGTGLGLAQVYGFMRQSGGHAAIYSEPGQGTTVKLYFPRLWGVEEGARGPGRPDGGAEPAAPAADGETVLVVEDEAMVRDFTVSALEEAGYRVLAAADGPSALKLLDAHRDEVAVLFTDVVLTGPMNGRKVADEALRRRPDLKVLFTTGYTRNAIIHQGRLDEGVNLLGKPFTAAALAERMGRLLDEP